MKMKCCEYGTATLSITTFSIKTLGITTLSITIMTIGKLSIYDTRHNSIYYLVSLHLELLF
jgi:hypothetical protein